MRRRLLSLSVLLTAAIAAGACSAGSSPQMNVGEALVELGDALNGVREENAFLQQQLDSLRTVVARQDTVIRKLSVAAGVPY